MKLHEILKTAYEYTMGPVGQNGGIGARFTTEAGEDVEVLFAFRSSYGMYGIDFTRDGRYTMTGGGDALRIFGTIMAIIDQFVRDYDPRGLFFAAHKTEASRVALYSRLIRRYTADGRYVDVTDSLDRLKDETTREWFAMKLDDGDRPDDQRLIVQASELLPVQEALDTAVDYTVKTAGARDFVATAEIDGKLFVFNAGLDWGENDYWDVEFAQKDPMGGKYFGVTNRGSQFKVGAFVAAAFSEFLDRYTPLNVTFSVDKEESPEARSKLYDRIMRRHGFKLVRDVGDTRIYSRV